MNKQPEASTPDWLQQKLQTGDIVLLDGAMGTELEARGVPMHKNVWSAAALLSHPETVRDTHIDYINAGASVLIDRIPNSGTAARNYITGLLTGGAFFEPTTVAGGLLASRGLSGQMARGKLDMTRL